MKMKNLTQATEPNQTASQHSPGGQIMSAYLASLSGRIATLMLMLAAPLVVALSLSPHTELALEILQTDGYCSLQPNEAHTDDVT